MLGRFKRIFGGAEMKDKELQELELTYNKAAVGVIDSLIRLVNAITEERNYYQKKCEELLIKKEEQK